MATFLDIGLLQKFEIIFPFLLVLVFIWGLLGSTKFLGENKFVHGFSALILALLVLISDSIREVINKMAPWFVLLVMFIMFLWMLAKTSGIEDNEIMEQFAWLKMTFLIIFFVLFIFTIINVMVWDEDTEEFGDVVTGGDVGGGGKSAVFATLRNPLILGMILILLIAAFTIQQLAIEK